MLNKTLLYQIKFTVSFNVLIIPQLLSIFPPQFGDKLLVPKCIQTVNIAYKHLSNLTDMLEKKKKKTPHWQT